MNPCGVPGCDNPKIAGQGQRYCESCSIQRAEARRVDNKRRIDDWVMANPERSREAIRNYNAQPHVREKYNAWRKRRRAENPYETWSTGLKERFNITAEQYEALLHDQRGCCALCGRNAGSQKRRLHVDHDHRCCPQTGRSCGRCIRGLLCFGCNRLLGWYESRRTAVNEYVDQSQIQPTAAGENQ